MVISRKMKIKLKGFLFDSGYDVGKGDKKSSRYRTIKRKILGKDGVFGWGLNSIDLCKAGSLVGIAIDPNSLIERLKLLILETKAGQTTLFLEEKEYHHYIKTKHGQLI